MSRSYRESVTKPSWTREGIYCNGSAIIEVFGSFGNEPMQSCSVHHVSLSLSSSSVSLSLSVSASVYSPPSDRFDHRSFISYKYMQLCA